MRILVVENDSHLPRHIRAALIRHGHDAEVIADGAEALRAALAEQPDLVLLDINLPSLDGFEVLAALRQAKCRSMILMLTARGEVTDRIRGLKAGADDYLAKPFALDELVARVEAIGRRGAETAVAAGLRIGDLHLDVPRRHVVRAGKTISLSPREFDLLQILMQEPGRVFARTELRDRVWPDEYGYDARVVDMFITRLRRKIDADFATPLIHTQRHVGYCIRLPV